MKNFYPQVSGTKRESPKIIKRARQGQAMVEYTFCMIATVLLLVGMIEVFTWMARDMVLRRQSNDAVYIEDIGGDQAGPLEQLTPYFYSTTGMKTVPIMSNIYDN